MRIPKHYVPKSLTKKNKKTQENYIKKSRKLYKKNKYFKRPVIKSFKSKVSPHILKARKMYNIDKIRPSKELEKKTGCKIQGLNEIVKKGMGAYYSSGSRPSQTPESWGYARLGSSITGGNASKIDYHILKKYCNNNSKALKMSQKPKSQSGGKNKIEIKPKTIKFKDYPDFTPNLTPSQIFKLGSFGGTYWRPITSKISKTHVELKDVHKKYPDSWWDGLSEEQLSSTKCDVSKNKYGVRVGTSLEFWEGKGWINEKHRYGWVHWYCDFYNGNRDKKQDEEQIRRWKGVAGPNGRFSKWLINMIKKKNSKYNDYEISPKIRQTLQHWGYQLTEKDFKS